MRVSSLLVVLMTFFASACASAGAGRPPVPPDVPTEYLHFSDAQVAVGDLAPDFSLPNATGDGETQLSSLRGRPVVLVFGSYT